MGCIANYSDKDFCLLGVFERGFHCSQGWPWNSYIGEDDLQVVIVLPAFRYYSHVPQMVVYEVLGSNLGLHTC